MARLLVTPHKFLHDGYWDVKSILTGWPQTWKTWNTQGFLWAWKTQRILREFWATSGKNCNKQSIFSSSLKYLCKTAVDWVNRVISMRLCVVVQSIILPKRRKNWGDPCHLFHRLPEPLDFSDLTWFMPSIIIRYSSTAYSFCCIMMYNFCFYCVLCWSSLRAAIFNKSLCVVLLFLPIRAHSSVAKISQISTRSSTSSDTY